MDKYSSKSKNSINMAKPGMGAPMNNNAKPGMGAPMDNNAKPAMGAPMDNNAKSSKGAPMDNNAKPAMGAPMDNNAKSSKGAPMDNNAKSSKGVPMDNNAKPAMGAPVNNSDNSDVQYKMKDISKTDSIYDFNSNMKDGFDPKNKSEMSYDLFSNQDKSKEGPPEFDMSTISNPEKQIMDVTGRIDKTQNNKEIAEKKEEYLQSAFDVSNKFASFESLGQTGGKGYLQQVKNEIVYDVDINGLGNKVNGNDNTTLYYELS